MAKQSPIFDQEFNDLLSRYLSLAPESAEKKRLQSTIVKQLMPYVRKIARNLGRRNHDPVDDLTQVGSIGVLKALKKYNPLGGSSFKTYATYYITGEIRHYLRDRVSMIKPPRHLYELYYRINQIIQSLQTRFGRIPTDLEIAEELDCPLSAVSSALQIDRRQLVSLDQFAVGESSDDTQFLERHVDEANQLHTQTSEDKMMVDEALSKLKEDLLVVVKMSFYDELSQSAIAEKLGISQMQVSRRLRKALKELYSNLYELKHGEKKPNPHKGIRTLGIKRRNPSPPSSNKKGL